MLLRPYKEWGDVVSASSGRILATLRDVDVDGFSAWLKSKVTSKPSEEMFTYFAVHSLSLRAAQIYYVIFRIVYLVCRADRAESEAFIRA